MKNIITHSALQDKMAIQGYQRYIYRIENFLPGFRLPFKIFSLILISALGFQHLWLTIAAAIWALGGAILPYHPTDYLYNRVIRKWLGKPVIPPRPIQLRFGCAAASIMLTTATFLLALQLIMPAVIIIGFIASAAVLVSTTDICLASIVYNLIFYKSIYPKDYRKIRIENLYLSRRWSSC